MQEIKIKNLKNQFDYWSLVNKQRMSQKKKLNF